MAGLEFISKPLYTRGYGNFVRLALSEKECQEMSGRLFNEQAPATMEGYAPSTV